MPTTAPTPARRPADPRRPRAGETVFEITETVRYTVPAASAAEAVERLLADPERERHFFEAVVGRTVG